MKLTKTAQVSPLTTKYVWRVGSGDNSSKTRLCTHHLIHLHSYLDLVVAVFHSLLEKVLDLVELHHSVIPAQATGVTAVRL